MFTTTKQPLDRTVLRYAGLVQGLVALPCMIQLVCSASLVPSRNLVLFHHLYSCRGSIFQVRRLEIVESVLATGLFIWLNFSWAIGTPERPFGHINLKRLIFSGLGVVVLFYGPLAHADAAWKDDERSKDLDFEGDGRTVYTDAPEKAPLELVRN
ncbi:hypothetical protein HBI56_146170 [Parastagonospora nodorum]|nr:hypothetical protein HBH54_209270 [Parastagonospora nodorum]KAH3951947.1 hypothetical protein HBH53_049440 [Parastagonospora nodorum]KAH3995737.1 hypothetical protein HBI10_167030 [Parastagonospora nodorum]KAH4015648.1 hypothetical protein HBI13_156620 [Parastagonospora nodorum]KAH4125133.1 hypothetical protein HBH47_059620 [Parastagonospora nodorum]